MKILYDHQIFELQKFGGISRYFAELIKYYNTIDEYDCSVSILHSDNVYLKDPEVYSGKILPVIHTEDPYLKFLKGINFKGKKALYLLRNKLQPQKSIPNSSEINKRNTIELLKKSDFDVFHPTFYSDYFLDYIGNKPYVLSVYDLIEEIFPELLMKDINNKGSELFKRASKIIVISENTKKDLINIFRVEESKIEITHLASSLNPTPENISSHIKIDMHPKYLLFVGTRHSYKNFYFFLRMFSVLEDKTLHVVCTGTPFSETEVEYIRKLNISERVHVYFATDADLIYLYKNAFAFIFPSLYEGFGLPLLEAFGNGCPVLSSTAGSLAEVGGDAALYFEPKDPESMLNAMESMLSNDNLRQDLIKKGYNRAKDFSWKKTSEETIEIYKKVLANQ